MDQDIFDMGFAFKKNFIKVSTKEFDGKKERQKEKLIQFQFVKNFFLKFHITICICSGLKLKIVSKERDSILICI